MRREREGGRGGIEKRGDRQRDKQTGGGRGGGVEKETDREGRSSL